MHQSVLKKSLFALIISVITVSALNAQAIEHTVQNEETLFSIAQKYDVTVQQLKKWNNLTSNAISIGQTLTIKKSEKDGLYTVKDISTLFSIAQRFDISVDQLKKWNNLKGNHINPGMKLRVRPPITNHPVKRQAVEKNKPADRALNSDGYYTVKSGDTLFRIAQMFGMEVEKLKALNNLSSNNIQVGQQLQVKPRPDRMRKITGAPTAVINYQLKQGMELQELLDVFEMNKEKFLQLNPDINNQYLNKGRIVRVTVPKAQNNAIVLHGSTLTLLGKANVLKYNAGQKGTVTTNGELYSPQALTAAHASMAIGSVIFVKNPANGRGVIIRINDRITKRGLKLSKAARQALGITGGGARVMLYRIDE